MSNIAAIRSRVSCRTYNGVAVEPGTLEKLAEYLQSNTRAPFGAAFRFELIDFERMDPAALTDLGTYGVIKGVRQFIAGAVADHPRAMEDFGYAMEKNIIAATAIGLGTCWLGGTFKRSGFAGKIRLAPEELLPAVTPIGYPAGSRSVIDRLFRLTAGSAKRKPWEELFFDQRIGTPLSPASAGRYRTPLDCVRIGPSASNKQPWRIVVENRRCHFYLQRTPGYGKAVEPVKLQQIDMGIAMCHFELACEETGIAGEWQVEDPRIESQTMEYLVSWIGRE